MSLWNRLFSRRKRMMEALDQDIRDFIARETQDNIERGMPPEDARYAALRKFGNVTRVKEETWEVWSFVWLEQLWQDVRFGLRQLRSSPGFTAVVVLTLALGIGANTAVFSLMNAVMLRELPVQNPGQLVLFGTGRPRGETHAFAFTDAYSYSFYREMLQKNQVFSDVSAVLSVPFEGMHGTLEGSGNLEPIDVQLVSGTYFATMGVRPILGRAFTEAEDEPTGGHPVAVASYAWWKRRLARDSSAVGKTLSLGSTVYTIIGVAPPEFFGTTVGESPDVWLPLSMEKQVSPGWNGLGDPWFESLYILARLKPGISAPQADANTNLLARQIWQEFAGPVLTAKQQQKLQRTHIQLTPAGRGLSPLRLEFSLPLEILMAVVGLVLLIACSNIANLLLARATTRQREIAVRIAMGAGRARLVRQTFTESLLMASFGGVLGIVFASWASKAMLAMVSAGPHPVPINVSPDTRVLIFTLLISLFTAILFGTVPAHRATRVNLAPALKEARGVVSMGGCGRLAKTLIVSQVALSLVLLVGAGLLLRTLAKLANVDTGFNKENVLLFGIDPVDVGYKLDSRLVSLYQQIEQRVSAEPGVRSASVSHFTFNEGEWRTGVVVQGGPPPENAPHVEHNVVGTGYFTTMGIPLLLGRVFGPQDTATSPKVAVINETMAREFFPGSSPLGRRFGLEDDPQHRSDLEVIGVVKDAKYDNLREKPQPAAYYPYTQTLNQYDYDLEVRYAGDPRGVISEVRRAVAEVDRRLPVSYQNSLTEQVDQSIADQNLVAELSTFFALLAAFLACIGIYGLMSYAVARSTNEIGVRLALGARKGDILRMVVGNGFRMALMGVTIGVAGALGVTRLLTSLLFGVRPSDPLTFVAVSLLLAVVALLACYIPARRATKVDPMVALRYE